MSQQGDEREHIGTNLSESCFEKFSIGTTKKLWRNTSRKCPSTALKKKKKKKVCSLTSATGVQNACTHKSSTIKAAPPRKVYNTIFAGWTEVRKSRTITRLHSSTAQQHNFWQQTFFNMGLQMCGQAKQVGQEGGKGNGRGQTSGHWFGSPRGPQATSSRED